MESIRVFFETNYKLSIIIFLVLVFLFLNLKRENKVGYIMMQFVILFFIMYHSRTLFPQLAMVGDEIECQLNFF